MWCLWRIPSNLLQGGRYNKGMILDSAIEELNEFREVAGDRAYKKTEYAYQLISLLMESQKLLTEQFFAVDYIDEKCKTLIRQAEFIKADKERL